MRVQYLARPNVNGKGDYISTFSLSDRRVGSNFSLSPTLCGMNPQLTHGFRNFPYVLLDVKCYHNTNSTVHSLGSELLTL